MGGKCAVQHFSAEEGFTDLPLDVILRTIVHRLRTTPRLSPWPLKATASAAALYGTRHLYAGPVHN
jgi:hypothetical protein